MTATVEADTTKIVCERLRAIGILDAAVVSDKAKIRVTLPGNADRGPATAVARSSGELLFYDWEPSLIGPEFTVGGHPGHEPPPKALKASNERWKEAGRAPNKGESLEEKEELKQETEQLIFAGAFPSAYGAVRLAAEQEPLSAAECEERKCTTVKPTYYLFSGDDKHELISGPTFARKDLYISATGRRIHREGEVIAVPAGTVVVSEMPQEAGGVPIEGAEPGWYALKDEPALTGTEITDPEVRNDADLAVVFEFTGSGRENFREVTRRIAQRGRKQAVGLVGEEEAEAVSGHFAVVLDNEVKTRPIINFAENPDGIDGRTGAQISGGFTSISDAQELAATLQIGALPARLVLIGEHSAG